MQSQGQNAAKVHQLPRLDGFRHGEWILGNGREQKENLEGHVTHMQTIQLIGNIDHWKANGSIPGTH